jgi:carbon-monoxide dehydrogenase medium subunit
MLTGPVGSAFGIAASHKRVGPFRLFRPVTLEEICGLLAESPDAVFHAGGIDLVNRMKAGLAPHAVIALGGVAELVGVRRAGNMIEIGAATTHRQLENDGLLKSCLPCIPNYVAELGNIRIRTQGTIGGNVVAAEPGYEMLALLAALDARFHFIARADGKRYAASARTHRPAACNDGDLLTLISISLPSASVKWNRDLRPTLGVVASVRWDGDIIHSGFGALSGQGPIGEPIEVEQPMTRQDLAASTRSLAERWADRLPLVPMPSGPRRDYCRHVAGVLMQRLLTQMTRESQ